MKNIVKIVALAAVALAFTQSVQAVTLPPITGSIGFSGSALLNSTTVNSATEVINWNSTIVAQDSTSGAFNSIPFGTAVSLASPWTFNSGALANFWQVGGFTFNLTSSSIFSQAGGFLNVVIAGTVTSTSGAFAATAFTGSFQVSNPSANGISTFTDRFSFNSVPDGGTTVLLLGAALSGLALMKRKMTA